jgi:hypothetical protein
MNIDEILNQFYDKHINYEKRIYYNNNEGFKIPLKWQKSKVREGRAVAYINEDHAKMLAAASGKDHRNIKLLQLGMTIPNHDDYLGVGKNFLTLMHRGENRYMVQIDHFDKNNPMKFPKHFDLSSRLMPPEAPETQPNEMMPEDFYM